MNKRKRVSLSIRLQPYTGTLLAEVVEWLNSHENDEKNNLIADAVIMAYLPYARASQDASPSEIERCCWETQNMLDKYGFNLRQSLQVSQPQWHPAVMPTVVAAQSSTNQSSTNGVLGQSMEDVELEDQTPRSLIEGEHDDDDDLFDDDGF
jgi:hypothetical protein